MRSVWRQCRMAAARRDYAQCADGAQAVGFAGGILIRTAQAPAFSVSELGRTGVPSRAHDALASGGAVGADYGYGPRIRSPACPCLAATLDPSPQPGLFCLLKA